MKDKYVLDSCIWIEIQRGNNKILSEVQPHIDRNEICMIDIIKAEVLRGTRTRKDYESLKRVFDDFPMLSTTWDRVAELAFEVGRHHFQPPLVDLYIAQAVSETKRTLVTQDKHFPKISKIRPLDVWMV
ncbi:MAG: PIN domain-containing protein [Deltaproteobacteria bacterium]|nr:PIN domain-containing protein [Deltaproteobacteria bacterium]